MGGTYEKIYFHLAKNSFRSIIKNYEFRNLVKYLPVSVFVNLGRGFLVLMKRGSFSALKGTMKAIFWNARFLSDTLAKRKDLREERVFSDSEIMRRCFLQKSLIKIYDRYFRGSKLLW
jgi:hypothetical protein